MQPAVIQLALDKGIQTVCIDETVGRKIARLNNLTLTGSIGIKCDREIRLTNNTPHDYSFPAVAAL